MKLLARQMNVSSVGATSARMLLCSALPTGASLNLEERKPISTNYDESYCQRQLMSSGKYSKISINRASTICGLVCKELISDLVNVLNSWHIGRCYSQRRLQHGHRPMLRMGVNQASTEGQLRVNHVSTEHQPSINRTSTEHQLSFNDF
jgi:hypothetical protein